MTNPFESSDEHLSPAALRLFVYQELLHEATDPHIPAHLQECESCRFLVLVLRSTDPVLTLADEPKIRATVRAGKAVVRAATVASS